MVVVAGDEVVMVQMLGLIVVVVMWPTGGRSVRNLRYDQGTAAGQVRRAEGFRVAERGRSQGRGEHCVDSGRASAPHGHGRISLFPAGVVQHGVVRGTRTSSWWASWLLLLLRC